MSYAPSKSISKRPITFFSENELYACVVSKAMLSWHDFPRLNPNWMSGINSSVSMKYSNLFKKALSNTFNRHDASVMGRRALLFGLGMTSTSQSLGMIPVSIMLLNICMMILVASSGRFFSTSFDTLSAPAADLILRFCIIEHISSFLFRCHIPFTTLIPAPCGINISGCPFGLLGVNFLMAFSSFSRSNSEYLSVFALVFPS